MAILLNLVKSSSMPCCQGKVGGTACQLEPSPSRADSESGRHTVGSVVTSVAISAVQQQDY